MESHLHRILHQTQQPIQNLEIHLFQRGQELMPNYHESVRHQLQQILTERGIKLHLGETVCKIAPITPKETKEVFEIKCESGLKVECNKITSG